MATAQDFVTIAATLSDEVAQMSADVAAAVAEIVALVNAGAPDLTAFDAPLASLTATAKALADADTALKAAPPAPPPAV
jgi:hypothetical protein